MVPRRFVVIAACVLVAGCAVSTERRAERALYTGHYNDAIHLFQATLAEHPDRLDARLGLGIALYKAGALADAAITLDEVLSRAPAESPALLYRGLIAIQQREDAVAEERLTRFRDLARVPRFSAQLERALRVLRGGETVGADTRDFIAISLEDAVRSAREVEQARLAAERAYLLSAFPPVRCIPTRRGWACFGNPTAGSTRVRRRTSPEVAPYAPRTSGRALDRVDRGARRVSRRAPKAGGS